MPSPSPHPIWYMRTSSKGRQGYVTNHAFTTAPFTSIMHNYLLCSTDILFSFTALFTLSINPIHCIPLNSTPDIGSYYSLHQPVLLHSLHVYKPPQHTALLDQPTLVISVHLHTTSFFTWSIPVTPHIVLTHLISITFNILSDADIHNVLAPYSAMDTAAPSYNLLFTLIPITLLLPFFLPSFLSTPFLYYWF